MIEVRFLGVGAALPAPGQTNCAFVIRNAGITLLFDCGPAILQQLAAVGMSPGDVTHLFVSHRHGDHLLGYPMFLLWRALGTELVGEMPTIIASSNAAGALRPLWDLVYPDGPAPEITLIELPTDQSSSLELVPGLWLRTWPMIHSDPAPVLGLRLETEGKVLALTADASWSDGLVELAREADLVIADARYGATVPPARTHPSRFHCTAREAGLFAQQAGARSLALVHIGSEYAARHEALVAEAAEVFAGRVFAPVAGDQVVL
jgi:ribonuclease BN (tRNA processing enzyme)